MGFLHKGGNKENRKSTKKKKMENSHVMMKEKLGLFGILKETLTILHKNPRFIILTSLPLFCSLLAHEIIFQQTIIETTKAQPQIPIGLVCSSDGLSSCINAIDDNEPVDPVREMIGMVSGRYLLLGLSYLGMVHLLDLFSTIVIVNSASAIYAREDSMNAKEMWKRSIDGVSSPKGPLITSIYALLMSSLSFLGLVSLATNFYITSRAILITIFFGLLCIAWLGKHMEWNAIWNMGVVLSVLEEKHGVIALGVSAYISRGSRLRGLFLMLIFFVWRLALRLSCLYAGWSEGGSGIGVTAAHVSLVCFGNVLKWVAFMVYFYDCKKRFLEKKVDVEQGTASEALK